MKSKSGWLFKWWAASLLAVMAVECTAYAFYNPQTGRWLSRDPISEDGGPNLFGFVANDTIGLYDPFGLVPTPPNIGDGWVFDSTSCANQRCILTYVFTGKTTEIKWDLGNIWYHVGTYQWWDASTCKCVNISVSVEVHEYGRERKTDVWRVRLIYDGDVFVTMLGPEYEPWVRYSRSSIPTGNFSRMSYETSRVRSECPQGWIMGPFYKQIDDPRNL